MSEILGYDCNGKALRAGDLVVSVGLVRHPWFNGRLSRVRGPAVVHAECVQLDERHHQHRDYYAEIAPCKLKRIDDQERGDWSDIEKATGWSPAREPAPA